jgi:putative hydrolase of the HAD superfamily
MDIKIDNTCFFIFDLDDTLYPEIDFVKSGYKVISKYLYPLIDINIYDVMLNKYYQKDNVFQWIVSEYKDSRITLDKLLTIYRNHYPNIQLEMSARIFIENLKKNDIPMGIITDGRSITQRNKLKALGIDTFFKDIIISEEFGYEKPSPNNFIFFKDKYPKCRFYFCGDNLEKDFVMPIKLGWGVFCLKDNGRNIHKQNGIHNFSGYFIDSFDDIELIFNE